MNYEGKMTRKAWAEVVAGLLRDAMPGSNAAGLPLRNDLEGAIEPEVPVFKVVTRLGRLPNIRGALRSAKRNAPIDRLPLAVIRDEGHKQQLVAMPLDAFLLLVAGWWAATQVSDRGGTRTADEPAPPLPRPISGGLRLGLRLDPPNDFAGSDETMTDA